MKPKLFWIAASIGAIAMIPQKANAHCRDGRKVCEYVYWCMKGNSVHEQRIRQGVHNNDPNEVFGELNGCDTVDHIEWHPRGPSNERSRGFGDDIGKDCNPGDYLATAKAGVELFDGNEGACNQIAP